MNVTKETRLESYIQRPLTRQQAILRTMTNMKRPVTARELAYHMGFRDLNAVKPRLTEMSEAGQIRTAGKAYDALTKRFVALWEQVNE